MQISVVIPVRNEAESIRALLDGLLSQSLPADEILITDGGSTDETRAIVEEYTRRHKQVRLFTETAALPGRGRNIAARNASYEWLAFIDAGMVPAQDWLAQLADGTNGDGRVDVVFGGWEPVTDTFFKECSVIASTYVPSRMDWEAVKRARAVVSSLMRRSVWQSVGGFPEELRSAEDILFINKIKEKGFVVSYAPGAIVRWSIQPNAWRTFKRFVVYSRNNLRAGLGAQWQYPVLRRYAMLLVCVIAAALITRWWPLIGLGLLLGLLSARALLSLWRNREVFKAGIARNVARFLIIVPLLLLLDVATIAGTAHWAARDVMLKAEG